MEERGMSNHYHAGEKRSCQAERDSLKAELDRSEKVRWELVNQRDSIQAELAKWKEARETALEWAATNAKDRDIWRDMATGLRDFVESIRPFLGHDPKATIHKEADKLLSAFTQLSEKSR
jgi:hypothetical protein